MYCVSYLEENLMSSNTELEGDVMEVQAHKGIHKNVEDLLEATGESF